MFNFSTVRAILQILFFMGIITPILQAQTFGIVPDSILVVYPPTNEYSYHSITLPNLTEDTLTMQWRLAEDSMQDGWEYFLCDLGECYSEMPQNEIMEPATGEEVPYLEITIHPNDILGEGKLIFYVNDINQPEIKQKLEFIFIVGSSSVNDNAVSDLQIYPNPAASFLNIEYNQGDLERLNVYNLNGTKYFEYQSPENQIDISYWLEGTYILQITTPYKIFTEKISISH